MILKINSVVNSVVWGWPMLILLVGCGMFYTLKLKFIQVQKFGYIMKNTLLKMFSKDQAGVGDISAFQAVSTALAATVGTGNIAGVALAIATGGPGAVFWMWLSAFFGMATKFSEVVLAIVYREKNSAGNYVGGPMYYIKNGLKLPILAKIFALFSALAAFGIGNMTQSNSIAQALNGTFGVDNRITGIVLVILVGVVVIGGIKRIGQVTEKLVPFMAAFYIIGSVIILITHASHIGNAFKLIFTTAFTPHAALGGFAGASLKTIMKMGVARGVFTNEAGLGSAPIVHATATTDHPVRQGMWGVFEVFMDTIVICTMTSLVILVTDLQYSGLQGAALTTEAFSQGLKGGGIIVTIGLTLFAFSTILGWAFYGEKCCEFLLGVDFAKYYRFIFVPVVYLGAIGSLTSIWDIADTLNGLMAIPNLIGLILLSKVVLAMMKDYFDNSGEIGPNHDYKLAVPEKFK